MLLSEQLKEKLRNEFMPIKTLKVYTNSVAINSKLQFIRSLDKGIRGVCSMILDFFEARCGNEESKQDNYMVVYASQSEMGSVLGYTREYISRCINRMSESPICPFVKIRQGLNKANYYIMQKKKEMVELLKQIFQAQQQEAQVKNEEKQTEKKQYNNYKKEKVSTFNDFKGRNYSKEDLNDMKYKLLGWT